MSAWNFYEHPQPKQVSATAIQAGSGTQRITARSGWIAWTLCLIPSVIPTSLKNFSYYTPKAIFQEGIKGLALSLLLPWRCHPPKLWLLQPLSGVLQEWLSLQQATKSSFERPLRASSSHRRGDIRCSFSTALRRITEKRKLWVRNCNHAGKGSWLQVKAQCAQTQPVSRMAPRCYHQHAEGPSSKREGNGGD